MSLRQTPAPPMPLQPVRDSPDEDESLPAEVLDDGQEEVFSRRAVERGLVADPKALGPEDLARRPRPPRRLTRE